jgi:aminopeptidase N
MFNLSQTDYFCAKIHIFTMKNIFASLFFASLLLFSCQKKTLPVAGENAKLVESEYNDYAAETPYDDEEEKNLPPYRPEKTLPFRLKHTKLEIEPVWEKQTLKGRADLYLSPYFYEQKEVLLDAKALEVFSVKKINTKGETLVDLSFASEKLKLRVFLDRAYKRGEEIILRIDYVAHPNKLTDYEEGYLLNEKGVYFVNPDGIFPDKPRQIWTQGETEFASAWFPTFDSPNVKTTQEIAITVDGNFQTLSNGKLIQTTLRKDGKRTDLWRQDLPHAPYLFMFVVGEFAIHREDYKGKPFEYWTEKKFAPHAKAVFGRTLQMTDFFSKLLGVEYPWDKYAQVVVRDYTSGAMENTSASVFMEGVQVDSVSVKDKHWDDIIAHELFHHWFGDLVTAESWANLPLNEAFANYSEYLWREHAEGKFSADAHRSEERAQYFYEAKSKKVPLIRFHHESPEDMFDSHSYAKGGLILHYLRSLTGDEAFFEALQLYLKRHAFGKAEIHQLRICFEDVTGQDWNWFFNQWFLKAGHPEVRFTTRYFNNELTVIAEQLQSGEEAFVYELPLDWEYGIGEKTFRQKLTLQNAKDSFVFRLEREPDYIAFDPDKIIPGEIFYSQSQSAWLKQIKADGNYFKTVTAIDSAFLHFFETKNDIMPLLTHKEAEIRLHVLDIIGSDEVVLTDGDKPLLMHVAKNDEVPLCRAVAYQSLGRQFPETKQMLFDALSDSSYYVRSNALFLLHLLGDEKVDEILPRYEHYEDRYLLYVVMEIYARRGTAGKMNWFLKQLGKKSAGELLQCLNPFTNYLLNCEGEDWQKGADYLGKLALHDNNHEVRQYAYQLLAILAGNPEDPENKDLTKNLRKEVWKKERDHRARKFMEQLR